MYGLQPSFTSSLLPSIILSYDNSLMSAIRNVARTDSRSMFHVPKTAAQSFSATDSTVPDSTRQFGVPLQDLIKRYGGSEALPPVIRKCTEFLEKDGLEVMGIFRRAPNNTKVHAIKRRFDMGKGSCDSIMWRS